jgi:Ni,Fe-hydrogenase I cytochrome b subunit
VSFIRLVAWVAKLTLHQMIVFGYFLSSASSLNLGEQRVQNVNCGTLDICLRETETRQFV